MGNCSQITDKTGVILCGCGPNISESVDLKSLSASISMDDNVSWVIQHDLPCSEAGREDILKIISDRPIGRLVVAGCSPKEKEQAFREMMIEAGLNPFLLQFANIREHCAWMENNIEKATVKATALVAAALARVKLHEPIIQNTTSINPDAMVIGAGIAGMEAAVLIAREGRHVHLIERSASVGGIVPLLGELYPSMECSSCALEPLMDEILHHENISVHFLSEVSAVRGFYGNFHIDILHRPRGVNPQACMGCRMCFEPCPQNAIHNDYEGAMPNAPLIDMEMCLRACGKECSACAEACPFGAIDLEQEGSIESVEAGAVIFATGSTPNVLPEGHVITAFQFERLVNPGGGTGGEIVLNTGKVPASVAVIVEGSERLSMMNAVKCAVTVMEKLPDASIALYAGDIRSSCVKETEHIKAIRNCSRVTISEGNPPPYDRVKADMIVLCRSMNGAAGLSALAASIGLELDDREFIRTGRELLEPASSGVPGVFVAGSASGTVTVAEAVLQGAAAAGRALSLLKPGAELELNPFTSHVDTELCSGCRTCLSACPYGAVVRDKDGYACVEEALCHGCGVCSSACPSGAMETRHFSLEQIMTEVQALCGSGRNQ